MYVCNCTDLGEGDKNTRDLKLSASSCNCTGRKNADLETKNNFFLHLSHGTLICTIGKPFKRILMKRKYQAIETSLINMELINKLWPIHVLHSH